MEKELAKMNLDQVKELMAKCHERMNELRLEAAKEMAVTARLGGKVFYAGDREATIVGISESCVVVVGDHLKGKKRIHWHDIERIG